MTNQMDLYTLLATCCPGTENILAGEIFEKLHTACVIRRGMVSFEAKVGVAISRLRCADNIYCQAGVFNVGSHKSDLAGITDAVSKIDLDGIISYLQSIDIVPHSSVPRAIYDSVASCDAICDNDTSSCSSQAVLTYHVSCRRSGKHTYSRFDAASAAEAGIKSELMAAPGTARMHDIAIRLDICDDTAEISVKLTDAAFRFRGMRQFDNAAIRPTLAHAIVRLTHPKRQDSFLDPFCGSGTIPCERVCYRYEQILCGDIDVEAVRNAAANMPYSSGIRPSVWDATMLPLDACSVDVIATNPPWGKQIQAGEDMLELYTAFLIEARRVIKPRGRIVLLTDRHDILMHAAASAGLDLMLKSQVSVHGTLAGIYA